MKKKLGRPHSKFLTFYQARNYMRKLKLSGVKEYLAWEKNGEKPKNIPSNPYQTYGTKFKGFKDYLGTEWKKYDLVKFYAIRSKIKVKSDWSKKGFLKLGINKPPNIPLTIPYIYKEEYEGSKEFLGTKPIPYNKLKKIVNKFKFKSLKQYQEYFRNNPVKGIRLAPECAYKNFSSFDLFQVGKSKSLSDLPKLHS